LLTSDRPTARSTTRKPLAIRAGGSCGMGTKSDSAASASSPSSSQPDFETRHGLPMTSRQPLAHRSLQAQARSHFSALVVLAATAVAWLFAFDASAAPEAHILRIDPRASSTDGSPVLTTVMEIVQNKRMSDLTKGCAALNGDAYYDCVATALD